MLERGTPNQHSLEVRMSSCVCCDRPCDPEDDLCYDCEPGEVSEED